MFRSTATLYSPSTFITNPFRVVGTTSFVNNGILSTPFFVGCQQNFASATPKTSNKHYYQFGVIAASCAVAFAMIGGNIKLALKDPEPFYNNQLFPNIAKEEAPIALNPEKFIPFPLIATTEITHDTKIFRFGLPSPNHKLGLPVASCIVVSAITPGTEPSKPTIRPYTPISKEDQPGYFDLLIKVYDQGGVMSKYIHQLKIGDKLEVKGPIPKIPYTANMKKDIGMIAGGTGITPMYQVIQKILDNPEDKTRVQLIFCNKSEDDILLKAQLDELAKRHSNFKVYYIVDKAKSANWKGGSGYISKEIIQKHIAAPSNDTLVLVCGPPAFYEVVSGGKTPDYKQGEVKGYLKELGYNEEQVFKF